MKSFSSIIYPINTVPTIIQEGNEKFVAFSHAWYPTIDENKSYATSDFLP